MSESTAMDVNGQFASQRAQQLRVAADRQARFDARLADGRLVALGGGRFRVAEPGTFDDGEILVRRGGQILPEHGLDMSTGTAALYSTTPAWHELGSIVPGGVSDIDSVLKLGGIDFDVVRRPVEFRDALDGPTRLLPDQFVTVRGDTGAGLGVVGARYEVMQNRTVFEFLQDLVERHDVVWESAGALRGGRRVFVSLRLPDNIVIDAGGVADEIVPFIMAVNSHDGSSLYQVVVTPWRPVCGNTERFALRDATARWGVRHTRNAHDRVDEARRTLGLSVDYYRHYADELEALARADLAIDGFRQVIDELWLPPEPGASSRTLTNHAARVQRLADGFEANSATLGRTAYAAERAITEFLDWGKTIRPSGALRGNNLAARATLALEGADDEVKTRAHRRLLTLTRR
jgi:phage/plasmid-like protein (TIGR03299 family)